MKETLIWFKGFFEDNNSGASTMRAMFWLWMLMLCFNLTFINVKNSALTPIDGSYVTITLGLAASKAGQRMWGEKETNPTFPEPK